ncbi:RNA-binding domain-containing protein [Phlegmacium glaucopus]|nr:RNA-binding domain-containing protein [Phlegmacium glaucopus]
MLQNYAFVQFESEKDAQVVLETYQHQPLLGRSVIIEFAHRLRKDMPSITNSDSDKISTRPSPTRRHSRHPVVVTNIPRGVRWQELKDFGRLSGRLVAYCDLDRTQRGRGFIEYFTKQDAERAVRFLDGRHLSGKRVRVTDYEVRRR